MVQSRSYTIQTEEGAVLRRTRRYLLKGPATGGQGTETVEQPQHTAENLSTENTAQNHGQSIRKSLRNVKPTQRLVVSI